MKTMIALILTVSLIAAPVCAQESQDLNQATVVPTNLTLQGWSQLPEAERQTSIILAVNSFLSAASSNDQVARLVKENCMSKLTILKVEKRMLRIAKSTPLRGFPEAFIEVVTCQSND